MPTVNADVAFGLGRLNPPLAEEEVQRRVAEALEAVGMAEYGQRLVSTLSGGQKQRVAIAGALAEDSHTLLLDELTTFLDSQDQSSNMASLANNCFLKYVSHSASSPATPTRGVGRFGTPRTVFSPVSYSPAKRAACNGDGETYCSSVLLKSVRPLLENLANHLADGQHKPTKSHVADEPLVKRPGIGRFEGKPAAAVLAPAPVAVTAAPVTPSAVLAPMVVTEVSLVAPVASTTPQVAEPTITTTEASARGAHPNEKARWDKLRQEVRAMDFEMTKKLRARAAYLRWAKLDQATWARDIEAAIEASLPAWIAPGKTVPPVSAAAATVADSAAPAAPSAASATTVKSPVAASPVRGASPAAQESRPAVAARCKVGVETVKGKNGCTSKVVSTGVKGGKGSSRHAGAAPCAAAAAVAGSRGAASSVRAGGKAGSRHASGVKRREVGGCGLGAAGRATGGRQGGVKAAGGRAVASGMCGREGVKQQAGRREGLVHERQARPGCSSSSRAHRRSS
ncbi:unnamed protein product [Closterium sp. NIES-53]